MTTQTVTLSADDNENSVVVQDNQNTIQFDFERTNSQFSITINGQRTFSSSYMIAPPNPAPTRTLEEAQAIRPPESSSETSTTASTSTSAG